MIDVYVYVSRRGYYTGYIILHIAYCSGIEFRVQSQSLGMIDGCMDLAFEIIDWSHWTAEEHDLARLRRAMPSRILFLERPMRRGSLSLTSCISY